MDDTERFAREVRDRIGRNASNEELQLVSARWLEAADAAKYEYNFGWLGLPIFQYPQDVVALQEIIWTTRPDVIVETGIARGGSTVFYASMLELLGGNGRVISIDVDIRAHNRARLEAHPMFSRVTLLEGSSTAQPIVDRVFELTPAGARVLLCLDSDHTHRHVLSELELLSPLVGRGSYIVVFDTAVEDVDGGGYPNRPWGKGNNPQTAVHEFLRTNGRFEIDDSIHHKLLLTSAPDGFLCCVRDP